MIGNAERYFASGWKVYEMVQVSDGMGGFTQASSSQASISGLMRPITGSYRLAADQDTAFSTHRFYCSPTTELTAGRYLSNGGSMYEVKFPADVMNMGRLMQADCEVVS